MKKLMIIAVVAIVAASAFAVPTPPWHDPVSVQIPVIMDIAPVASIELNGAQIKLELSDESTMGQIVYEGVADPQPQLRSNVSVEVQADIAAVEPSIVNLGPGGPFGVALRNQAYVTGPTAPVQYDPLAIGAGIGIEVAVGIWNPDLTVRQEGLDVPVAVVTLTVTPLP